MKEQIQCIAEKNLTIEANLYSHYRNRVLKKPGIDVLNIIQDNNVKVSCGKRNWNFKLYTPQILWKMFKNWHPFYREKILTSFFLLHFFHNFPEKKLVQGTVSPDEAPKNTLGSFQFFWKIHEDIHKWKYTIGINNTGGKFATGVNNTSGKFATSAEFATDINNMRQILPLVPLVSTTPMANYRRYK